jgi:hypothetical protein
VYTGDFYGNGHNELLVRRAIIDGGQLGIAANTSHAPRPRPTEPLYSRP